MKAGPRLATLIGVAFLLTALLARLPAHAEDTTLPAPKTVIYPGEIIREDMLADMPADNLGSRVGPICDTRNALVGKMARRTLLPGEAIAVADVSNPRLVVNGAEVTLYYIEEGLSIATSASALQDGAAGDTVRVRNNDSGVVISGAVQPDGSVRVGGG